MSKKRDIEKERHYKNIINKQKKLIQSLKRKAGRAEKLEERYTDLEERESELTEETDFWIKKTEVEHKSLNTCPKCKNDLYVIQGDKITVFICQDCNYRSSTRKI